MVKDPTRNESKKIPVKQILEPSENSRSKNVTEIDTPPNPHKSSRILNYGKFLGNDITKNV
uniref:Uncharacterized protein n=1 Tax=viral metagenome TaxID=1070528 RepID=A0A6M3KDG6_9ZZZZ